MHKCYPLGNAVQNIVVIFLIVDTLKNLKYSGYQMISFMSKNITGIWVSSNNTH